VTRRARSLQARLLVPVLGLVAAVWLIIAAATWFDVRHEIDELLDGHLAQAAALVVVNQTSEDEGDEVRTVEAPVLHRYARKAAFQVFRDGRLERRSANAPTAPMRAPGEAFDAGFSTIRIDGAFWRVYSTHGAEPGTQVYVGEEFTARAAIFTAVVRSTLAPLMLALPLLGLAVWWAVRRGVAPLRRLGAVLAARSPQALDPVIVNDAPAEMLPMVDALNGLLARIGELVEAERRFTADAAHELRTPLAAIRAQAQVALAATDDAQRSHALRATLQGCDRTTRLVEQMLTLARLESGVAAAARTRVDLAAVARAVVAELAPQAMHKQQIIELDAAGAMPVAGDATLLAVLMRNLVDNAIRYSPPSARVAVALAGAPGLVRLSIEDSGPGLAEADAMRVGERFFRVAGSGQGGSGLGMSIVRRIAAAHGATVEVASGGALGGLSVRVDFATGMDPPP
jgi:two-component system, OmpR family, sensor histidine kinase QseC